MSSSVRIVLGADAASWKSVVLLTTFNLLFTGIMLLPSDVDWLEPDPDAVPLVEEKDRDHLVYNAMAKSWNFGLITKFPSLSGSVSLTWGDCCHVILWALVRELGSTATIKGRPRSAEWASPALSTPRKRGKLRCSKKALWRFPASSNKEEQWLLNFERSDACYEDHNIRSEKRCSGLEKCFSLL